MLAVRASPPCPSPSVAHDAPSGEGCTTRPARQCAGSDRGRGFDRLIFPRRRELRASDLKIKDQSPDPGHPDQTRLYHRSGRLSSLPGAWDKHESREPLSPLVSIRFSDSQVTRLLTFGQMVACTGWGLRQPSTPDLHPTSRRLPSSRANSSAAAPDRFPICRTERRTVSSSSVSAWFAAACPSTPPRLLTGAPAYCSTLTAQHPLQGDQMCCLCIVRMCYPRPVLECRLAPPTTSERSAMCLC